ncbi:MAG: HypC/HybG/HupF family hydrogenase formation chaperone [Rubrivivax sp.]|nr:HypC/HybG/HupF family hydrogenase formation chaperone [Rubrivivax sp.]
MCIGWPMQVLSSGEAAALLGIAPEGAEPAAAERALAQGRGRTEHVDLRLVGPCAPGDWVLVYQGAARERLDPQRAAEIHAALDLVERGLGGAGDLADTDPGFELPSAMSPAQLAALVAGGTAAT